MDQVEVVHNVPEVADYTHCLKHSHWLEALISPAVLAAKQLVPVAKLADQEVERLPAYVAPIIRVARHPAIDQEVVMEQMKPGDSYAAKQMVVSVIKAIIIRSVHCGRVQKLALCRVKTHRERRLEELLVLAVVLVGG